jgi:hypothetical protein
VFSPIAPAANAAQTIFGESGGALPILSICPIPIPTFKRQTILGGWGIV